MSEWKPFDTAPRDGRVFRARQGKWAWFHMRYRNGEFQPVEFGTSNRPTHWSPVKTDIDDAERRQELTETGK